MAKRTRGFDDEFEEKQRWFQGKAKELRRRATGAERLLWSRLRKKQLSPYRFRRQRVIGERYIVDFYCISQRLVVEIDGPYHLKQIKKDQERDLWLASRGIRTLRFTNSQVLDSIEDVLASIFSVLQEEINGVQQRGGARAEKAL